MEELNNYSKIKTKIIDECNAVMNDTFGFSQYISSGYMAKKKKPIIIHNESFKKK